MNATNTNITVLISSRKNSKYLAKFLSGLLRNTMFSFKLDVRVMLNEHDTWNDDITWAFANAPAWHQFTVSRENKRLGRAGLHEYFNTLLDDFTAPWIVYFCDDHYVSKLSWDEDIRQVVSGVTQQGDSAGKQFPLDPDQVWVIVPKFDNCGAMNHIVSRGFIKAMGGKLGRHGWIDSYINDLMANFPERVIRMDEPIFHDFTHDKPDPMSPEHTKSNTHKAKGYPEYDSEVVRSTISIDKHRLYNAIKKEGGHHHGTQQRTTTNS